MNTVSDMNDDNSPVNTIKKFPRWEFRSGMLRTSAILMSNSALTLSVHMDHVSNKYDVYPDVSLRTVVAMGFFKAFIVIKLQDGVVEQRHAKFIQEMDSIFNELHLFPGREVGITSAEEFVETNSEKASASNIQGAEILNPTPSIEI